MIEKNKPLVSIIVIAYNSGKYIIDTLESARNQDYKNIELIISDDCSTDDTAKICSEWLSKNKDRFVRTKLITVKKNTGIAANFKRGFQNSSAEWIKFCAGDDALLPNCIEDNINYVLKHPDIRVLYSYNRVYRNEFTEENFLYLSPSAFPTSIINDKITAYEQYKLLLMGDRVPFTPSAFLNRKALKDAGLPDEDLFSEDYQLKLKLTKSGNKFNFMEKETVLYRQSAQAINNRIEKTIVVPHFFKTEDFRKRYIYPNVPTDIFLSHKHSWIVNQIFRIKFFNRDNKVNRFIHYTLNIILNPFKYVIYIKSHYISKYKNDEFYNT